MGRVASRRRVVQIRCGSRRHAKTTPRPKSDTTAAYRAVRVLGFNWLFAVFPLPDLASRVAASEVVEYWNT